MSTGHRRSGSTSALRARAASRPSLETLEARLAPAVAATFTVNNDWGSGFQGEIRLTNSDAVSVQNWALGFDLPVKISSIWDAQIGSQVGNRFTIRGAAWNTAIPARGAVSFGFVASPGNLTVVPTNYTLNGAPLGENSTPTLPDVSVGNLQVNETGQANFTVRLSRPSTSSVSVRFATADGTARAGSDYTAASGLLTFSPGQTELTLPVTVLEDRLDEPDESFRLVLSSPIGASLGQTEGVATILDDDLPATPTGDASFRVVSDWGSGFTGEIAVRNSGASAIQDWRIEFDFAGQIGSIWNASVVSRVGDHYIVRGADWNRNVAAGATVTFGFNASPGQVQASTAPRNIRFVGSGGDSGGGAVNRPPVAVNDTGATTPGSGVTLAVLLNDSDPDGDTLRVQSVSQAGHGTVTLQADGTLRYQPASGFTGSDAFQYTISDGRGGTASAQVTVQVAERAGWPANFYAPYVDTTLWPTYNFAAVARDQGLRFFTLAFITADPSGKPAWGGYSAYAVGGGSDFEVGLRGQIDTVRSLGGDVMISFGGASNRELAEVITDVTALKNAYRQVIDAYQVTHVDFDIEGAATADRASVDRRSQALAALQTDLRAVGRSLAIWYTLPVLPSGLTPDGYNVLDSARRFGVEIAGVNIMTMDFGDSAAPNPQGKMGDYSIEAARSLHTQLRRLYGATPSDAQLWALIGITPMIGRNDVLTEVFDQQEAREVLAFARQVGIQRISMWSLNRDYQNAAGQLNNVDLFSSSILQTPLEFSLLWNSFNTL
ncbi:MAG: cellulose binding domain-containing protein [Gemmataceae bacterium]